MKKKVLIAILVVSILIISFSVVSFNKKYETNLGVLLLLSLGSKNTSYEKEQFNKLSDDYEATVKYLITNVIADYPDEENICLGLESHDIGNTLLYIITDVSEDNIYLDISDEIAQSLYNIKTSFSQMGCGELDAIRIENGIISFTSIDGVYSLTYKLDKKSDISKIQNREPYNDTEKLKGKWKHTIS